MIIVESNIHFTSDKYLRRVNNPSLVVFSKFLNSSSDKSFKCSGICGSLNARAN